ncbi:MAG: fumarate/nitrate reduction transcriptional regulator Fnr [Gammaproteobacteria bacterium]|uniref:fumarate/nitrate reduction transcriptional regulator Fnr n=1 Tax=Pseudomaricurvus alcaniphilus TaxID=1166482 RepID=UPI00140BB21C|nr:fumarate/nitrate reduction transcriptional regulator Fnr [Pseudomaricurvus alcaniphilus]MBR9911267.1 fumarate/nitrate reduction transcriptional regulator Fnr [Gammaproteobacteria bacterium]NHN37648.1 fumarate/nitrate reduction transcriptional regulator Fnr [Pseudomaricurvus alcaniphilus]
MSRKNIASSNSTSDSSGNSQAKCHHNPLVSCGDCRLNAICLPISLHVDDIDRLDEIIQRGRPLQKGEYLYHTGAPFRSVFAIRSGTIKAISITNGGQEQVTGFYLPGEILGMDGIAQNHHTNSAIALETAAVCEIPFSRLEELSLKLPGLQRHFFSLMSKEITSDQQLITLLSKNSADERVASLLLSISTRNHHRHLSATCFRLPMSRADIGNYLGLTIETVSRVLSRFQKSNLLAVDKKEITILDMDALKKVAQAESRC